MPDAPPAGADQVAEAQTTAQEPKLRYSDTDFLRLVRDERMRSIGFGEGDNGELAKVRIKSQEYRQGKISDVLVMKGRSTAADTTLGDSIDTVMPDLMELFFAGDEVVTFDADGETDEAQAREESDVLAKVVFGQNDAFRAFHDTIQDALLNRTGLFTWWWEQRRRPIGTQTARDTAEAAAIGQAVRAQRPWAQFEQTMGEDGSVEISVFEVRGKACFKSVASEDFTVAEDTVTLRDSAYCAMRDRVRVQDLIARGVKPEVARALPPYNVNQDGVHQVRDLSGEDQRASAAGLDDLRMVEVRTHYIRLDADDDGELEIWRVETDVDETRLLQRERATHIQFGVLTPYLNAHRLHGQSLYDKLQETVRVKTVLKRMLLDSGYFALNQRYEVSDDASNEFTLADMFNNAPNVPVRSKNGQAVRPLQAGQLGFDVMGAIEFMSTVAEQQSGVFRGANGLKPDTLHETARGMVEQVVGAQKRVRFIGRVLAETGVKDLFLGLHQLLRENMSPDHAPLRKKDGKAWKDIRPEAWPEREDVSVHVGAASAERDIEMQEKALELTERVISLQGGVNGPFVTPQNVFSRLRAFSRALGERDTSVYWTDPGEGPVEPPGGGQSPEQAKAAAEMQVAMAKLQGEQAIAKARLAGELQLQQAESQGRMALERFKAEQAIQLQRLEAQATAQLEAQKLAMGDRNLSDVNNEREALPGGMG